MIAKNVLNSNPNSTKFPGILRIKFWVLEKLIALNILCLSRDLVLINIQQSFFSDRVMLKFMKVKRLIKHFSIGSKKISGLLLI